MEAVEFRELREQEREFYKKILKELQEARNMVPFGEGSVACMKKIALVEMLVQTKLVSGRFPENMLETSVPLTTQKS